MRNLIEHLVCSGDAVALGIEFDEVVGEKGVAGEAEAEDASVDGFTG